MLWPIVLGVAGAVWGLLFSKEVRAERQLVLEVLISGLFGVLVGLFLGLGSGAILPKDWGEPEIVKLVSLRDGESISGRFVLGSGNVRGVPSYLFYKEDRGEGYQSGVIVSTNVTIIERARQDGELRIYTKQLVRPWWKWIGLFDGREAQRRYEFVVPEGSLSKAFLLQ